MFHQPSQHLRYGTTLFVVNTRVPLLPKPQSPCIVPVRPVLITCTIPALLVLYLQCTWGLSAYRYLIVHFPMTGRANFCELEVYIRRKFFYDHRIINCLVIYILNKLHVINNDNGNIRHKRLYKLQRS